jgi:hypothetical protein
VRQVCTDMLRRGPPSSIELKRMDIQHLARERQCAFASCSEPATHYFVVDDRTVRVCQEHAQMLQGPQIVIKPLDEVLPRTGSTDDARR